MRVTDVRLENFKCYEEADLDLSSGITVVHGVNGSGKSTLLEAIFFALYGSKALDDRTLDDVVTTGAETTAVELGFTHEGEAYRIERRLKRRDERTSTTKCVLDGPDGTVDGARDVRGYVTSLLRMDATAFVNCAYVRQGEVNKLIHASPAERQDMIDDLLQLGALEAYRERANEARLGVSDVLDEVRGEAATLDEQIEDKRDADLHDRLNELETKRGDVEEDIEHFEAQRERAVETRDDAREVLETHEERRAEIESLDEEIESLQAKIEATESDRTDASERIADLDSTRSDLETRRTSILSDLSIEDVTAIEDRLDELDERDDDLGDELADVRVSISETSGAVDQHEEKAEALADDATEAREQAAELEADIEAARETIEERESALADLDDEIEDERAAFEDVPIEFGDAATHRDELRECADELAAEIADLVAERTALESAIEDAEALLEACKCPECGQPVEGAPHVSDLSDRRAKLESLESELAELREEQSDLEERIERAESLRESEQAVERLRDNRETTEQLLSEKRESVAEKVDQCEQLRADAEEAEREAERHREQATERAADVEEHRSRLGEINAKRADLRSERESLETAQELSAQIEDCEETIERLRERRADWETMNDERREQLSTARDRRAELEAALDEERLETATEDLERAEEYIEQVDEKLETLRERRSELQSAIGAVENELEELESLVDRREAVEQRLESLAEVYDEAETLQETYATLRSELRQRNVETLDRLLNETFDLVYQNDTYAGIDLDGSYQLTVYQKDGAALDPEQLSGGERALFNLSLRCAIYRLLAEGVEGAGPLPPLILDEPTVFLDAGHVGQLITLVETMRDLGVEQILLVSHDEELVGAADELVHVETDPTTNRSSLSKRAHLDQLPMGAD
ncbi:ATPase involved in DNA repair [Halovivax ruber XH-70]|uniref:DNA double-strand break repair Rad50 ATPase n=1 Tax=Halovivax ruber (strain DSM 18193 / JCM 13892 / XH-70) TaxID=797302 RepID=L0IC62_HALRX|nr:DNA double-strand break repair ATPase Rad50 [Halovivax ruber]AGB15791.1 ATPase involved in DNA repair [Halovivax ruber XH-70]